MKVVVIGGGVISSKLILSAPAEIKILSFKIRGISDLSGTLSLLMDACKDADIVIYMAYHHRDLPKNLRLLYKILSSLNSLHWQGKLVFFNTQSTLASSILINSKGLKEAFSYDLYTTTKRLQSWLLSRYDKLLNISEIYLPVVIGIDTKAQRRYEFISKHKKIHLPNKGKNLFAFLDVDVFLNWFWSEYTQNIFSLEKSNQYRKLFVYQGIRTFVEMIKLLRYNCKVEAKDEGHEIFPSLIKDCSYKYRFADDFSDNLIFRIKISPIWLLFSIIRNEIKKISSSDWSNRNLDDDTNPLGDKFYPIGPEYHFLNTNTDLSAVSINMIKVNP
jgi:hypothetical protein